MSKLFRNSPDNVILTKLGFFSDEGREIPLLACVERKVLLPLLAQGEGLSQKKNEMEKAEASFATLGSCILFKNAHSFLVMLVLVRLPLPFRCFAIQLALSFRRSLVSLLLIATLSEFHEGSIFWCWIRNQESYWKFERLENLRKDRFEENTNFLLLIHFSKDGTG